MLLIQMKLGIQLQKYQIRGTIEPGAANRDELGDTQILLL